MTLIHHLAICVVDLEESLRFWRDGIGMDVLMDQRFRGDWPHLFGAPTDSLRAVFLGDPRIRTPASSNWWTSIDRSGPSALAETGAWDVVALGHDRP